ncbi:hypothetical protein [Medusavirus stheno T3]|uniref:Uncharacterized protein n=1 Tax=Medusavirus stheno T3 TaxID=3069717 RepID=A0A7S7YEE7_9VIRU|nr:hypothetical protein QKU73_gp044 [Acanthamoeba castellanii medusavirus]QPB44225.1 hypothetical protein [Medusavirus stheno T3]
MDPEDDDTFTRYGFGVWLLDAVSRFYTGVRLIDKPPPPQPKPWRQRKPDK